jgi:chromosomal replication initiation ATPase DnaA
MGKGPLASHLFNLHVAKGADKQIEKMMEGPRWPAILGSVEFVDAVRKQQSIASPSHDEKPQEKELERVVPMGPQEVLASIEKVFGLLPTELKNPNQNTAARRAAYLFLRFKCHLDLDSIGRRLGGVKASAVSKGIKRAKQDSSSEMNELRKIYSID